MAKLQINREGGDTIFYTVTGGVATEVFRCTADGTLTPLKEIAGAGAVPVGGVIAWIPGYFGTTPNQGYASVLAVTDTVANANVYLSPKGWRVCDGTALNDATSPIWNAAGRYLPHIADSRFLQGSATVGGTSAAGANVLTDHNHTTASGGSLTAAGQTLGSSTVVASVSGGSAAVGAAGSGANTNLDGVTPVGRAGGALFGINLAHTHAASAVSGSVGGGADPSSTENRPQYLKCFYIVRVK